MKKGKYLILGLFPLAISTSLLHSSTNASSTEPMVNFRTGSSADNNAALPDNTQSSPDMIDQLVLNNAAPRDVIGILEKLTGRTALMEKLPSSAGAISIDIQEPISRLEAISAIESILSLNGLAVVDMGDKFIKIVASKTALSQSPKIVDESLSEYEPTQCILSKFFKLKYYDANEFNKLIKPILTPSSSNVIVFNSSNSLFITDTMANLQRVENLIARTDTPIQMVEDIKFIPLNNVKSSAVVKKFEQLKRGSLKKYLSNVTIDSDDSSNQLIIITPHENINLIENLAKQLDNRCELLLRSEVIRIKHGEAKKITDIVSGIIKEQRSRIERENKAAFERQQAQMSAQSSLASALAQAASGSRSNQQISNSYSDFIASQPSSEFEEEQTAQFSANLTLTSDDRSNSIIVYGTQSDLVQVRHLISSLDVLLDQVRIEVIVAQVTYNNNQQSGLDSFNISYNVDKNCDPASKVELGKHEIYYNIAGFGGSSTSGLLRHFSLNTVFQKAKSDSNVKILATPTLVTTHNRKAQFKTGENRPFMESSTKSDDKDAKERINVVYKDVGYNLVVTPLIGSNGIIQMEIKQNISAKGEDATIAGNTIPVITNREIESFVSVADGDVIVLAGFKERAENKGGSKTFLLGDLPLVGDWLFSPKKRDERITELIVFIKPTIILQPQDEASYLDQRLANTQFKEDIDMYKKTGDFKPTEEFPKDTIVGLAADNFKESRKLHEATHSRTRYFPKEDQKSEDSKNQKSDKKVRNSRFFRKRNRSEAVEQDEVKTSDKATRRRTRYFPKEDQKSEDSKDQKSDKKVRNSRFFRKNKAAAYDNQDNNATGTPKESSRHNRRRR